MPTCVPVTPGGRVALPRPGVVLIEEAGAPVCRAVRFGAGPLTLGRSARSELVVDDEVVSGRHATLTLAPGGVLLDDLGKNGTWVEGERVTGRALLAGEALVSLGASLALVVEDVTPFEERSAGVEQDHAGRDYVVGPRHAATLSQVRAAGEAGLALFVRGESGTGKEQAARRYHAATGRRGPLEEVDATTVKAELAESQLFGHRRGAFSGAERDQKGKLVLAHGGTLFFDEVGDMAPLVQPRLLRVLQERRVTPVGAETATPIDVRLVSATNRDVRAMIAAGAFREDLYVRLAEVEVALEPLRARREEIPWLVRLALRQLADARAAAPMRPAMGFVEACCLRPWRGENVRGLLRAVKAAVLAAERDRASEVGAAHLPPHAGRSPVTDDPATPTGATGQTGQTGPTGSTAPMAKLPTLVRLREALAHNGGSLPKAAKEIGISRTTAYDLWKRWGG